MGNLMAEYELGIWNRNLKYVSLYVPSVQRLGQELNNIMTIVVVCSLKNWLPNYSCW